MNRTELIYAFGEIDDRYILEAGETPKRKGSKRIVMILIAAAVLIAGALGAAAYYEGDVSNGMRWRFLGGDGAGDTEALDGITSRTGKITGNSFDGLDVSFSGAICDNEELYAVFIISRTDGTAFTLPEGYAWRVGYTELSYAGLGSSFMGDERDAHNFHTSLNDDGTLSVTITGTVIYRPGEKFYDYEFAFTNLYCAPEDCYYDSSDPFRELSDVYWLGSEMAEKYTSGDKSGAEELEEQFFAELASVSAESFEGAVTCRVDSSSLKIEIPSYEFEYRGLPVSMDISPLKVRVSSGGPGWDLETLHPEPAMEIYYVDGTSEQLECREYSGGGNIDDSLWEMNYSATKPINISQIDYVLFDGVRIEIGQ